MRHIRLIVIAILAISCTSEPENPLKGKLEGVWNAQWEMDRAAYADLAEMDFTMSGEFQFFGDSIRIQANGYEGCIFSTDTLINTSKWTSSNDTLHLVNEDNAYGLSYKVKSLSEGEVELQLMEDIIITLTK